MNQKFLNKLEYNKVLCILENFAKTNIGKEYCKLLSPSSDKEIVISLLNETCEAKELIENNGSNPIEELPEIMMYIPSLHSNNSLSTRGLLDICFLLKMSRELKEYFSVVNKDSFLLLANYFDLLYINESIEKNISTKILDENTIDDHASQKLYNIRKEQKQLKLDIRERLNYFIHSSNYSKYLQDNIITMRNERFVLPVKEEYQGQIKGFVHDISSSGSTVFIEPLSVFELNNKLNALLLEENVEIQKILANLSTFLFPIADQLVNNFKIIGKLDFIFAKAKYSTEINGISPIISNKKEFNLVEARHPLINKNDVVPISINLGAEFNSLIITRAKYWWKNCCSKNCWASYFNGTKWFAYSCFKI